MRLAVGADTTKVLATLSSAFRADPVWAWIAPDPRTRATVHEALFAPSVEAAVVRRTLWVTDDVEAVAVYVPPGQPEVLAPDGYPPAESVWSHGLGMLGPHATAVSELFDRFDQARPAVPEHFYLSLLGTHESHRGRGVGMQLLRETLTQLDDDGHQVYLESTNPSNDARYHSVGFADSGEIALPDGSARIRTMWRESRGPDRPRS